MTAPVPQKIVVQSFNSQKRPPKEFHFPVSHFPFPTSDNLKITSPFPHISDNSCNSPDLVKILYQNSMSMSYVLYGLLPMTARGENGNWSCGPLAAPGKSPAAPDLLDDSTSDQKFSSISGKSSGESTLMQGVVMSDMVAVVVVVMVVAAEEISLKDCCGDSTGPYPRLSDLELVAELMGFCCFSTWDASRECLLGGGVAWLCLSLFFKWVCHTFFISLSVLPGSFAAIADHLLPSLSCNSMMVSSSSLVKFPRLISGLR